MKKILSLLIALALICGSMLIFASCGGDSGKYNIEENDINIGSLNSAPDGYQKYEGEQFSFVYPLGWMIEEFSDQEIGRCALANPKTGENINISVFQESVSRIEFDNRVSENINGADEDLKKAQLQMDTFIYKGKTNLGNNVYSFEYEFLGMVTKELYAYSYDQTTGIFCEAHSMYTNGINLDAIINIFNSIKITK